MLLDTQYKTTTLWGVWGGGREGVCACGAASAHTMWVICGDGGPDRSQFACRQYTVKRGLEEGIMDFRAHWELDEEGTARLRPGVEREKLSSGATLVRFEMNEEALANLMDLVRLGAGASLQLTGRDPVQRTVGYLMHSQPLLQQSIRVQTDSGCSKPHPHVSAYRKAVAIEQESTARALGVYTSAACKGAAAPAAAAAGGGGGGRRKGLLQLVTEADSDSEQEVVPRGGGGGGGGGGSSNKRPAAGREHVDMHACIEQKVGQHCGPLKQAPLHAAKLRRLGRVQEDKVVQMLHALHGCIIEPLTEQCAGHRSRPTSLNIMVVKNLNDLVGGVFAPNSSCGSLHDEARSTEAQRGMCGGIVVSEVVYDKLCRQGVHHNAPCVVLCGDLAWEDTVATASGETLHDFLNTHRDSARTVLKQHFDNVLFKSSSAGSSMTASRSHAPAAHHQPFVLNVAWHSGKRDG